MATVDKKIVTYNDMGVGLYFANKRWNVKVESGNGIVGNGSPAGPVRLNNDDSSIIVEDGLVKATNVRYYSLEETFNPTTMHDTNAKNDAFWTQNGIWKYPGIVQLHFMNSEVQPNTVDNVLRTVGLNSQITGHSDVLIINVSSAPKYYSVNKDGAEDNWQFARNITQTAYVMAGRNVRVFTRIAQSQVTGHVAIDKAKNYSVFYNTKDWTNDNWSNWVELSTSNTTTTPATPTVYQLTLESGVAYGDRNNTSNRAKLSVRDGVGLLHLDFKVTDNTSNQASRKQIATLPNDAPTPIALIEHQLYIGTDVVTVYIEAGTRTVWCNKDIVLNKRIIVTLTGFFR